MEKKYLVVGGYVVSQYDGQRHYVSANRLMELYGVDRSECVYEELDLMGVPPSSRSRLIRLFPRRDGDYRIPSSAA